MGKSAGCSCMGMRLQILTCVKELGVSQACNTTLEEGWTQEDRGGG